MQYPVITSKTAEKDYANIKAQHAEIVRGFADQSARVATYNQQKQAEAANETAMNNEMEKERMTASSEAQKTALTFQQKQAELDIKRAALSSI